MSSLEFSFNHMLDYIIYIFYKTFCFNLIKLSMIGSKGAYASGKSAKHSLFLKLVYFNISYRFYILNWNFHLE